MEMKRFSLFLSFFAVMLLMGAGCQQDVVTDTDTEPVIDRSAILQEAKENGLIMNEEEVTVMADADIASVPELSKDVNPADVDTTGWLSGALADVTGGSAYGIASAQFANGTYELVVTTGGLTQPSADYFYEGWVVRRGDDMSVISTGALEVVDGAYVNTFMSSEDLTDHTFYVLTLEPDDGDPAPAEHILEGTMK